MDAEQFVGLLEKTAGRFNGVVGALKNWAPSIGVGGAAAYGDYRVSGDPWESLALGVGAGALLHPAARQKMRNYGLSSNATAMTRPVGSPGHMTENAALWDGLIKGHTLGAAGKAGLFAAFRVPGILDNANQATKHLNNTLANVDKATGDMIEPGQDGRSAFAKVREGLVAVGDAGVSAGSDIADSARAFSGASKGLSGLTNSLNDISQFVKGTPENPGLLTRAINSQEQLGKTFADSLDWVKSRAPYIAGGALGLTALKLYLDHVKQRKEDERDERRLGYRKAALFDTNALSTSAPAKIPVQTNWGRTQTRGKPVRWDGVQSLKPAIVKQAYAGYQHHVVNQFAPAQARRELTSEEQQQIEAGQQKIWPHLFQSYETKVPDMMSSPTASGVGMGLLGGGIGASLGSHISPGVAALGGLVGAGVAGLPAYFGRQAENANLQEIMRRLPEGANRRDLLSDPVENQRQAVRYVDDPRQADHARNYTKLLMDLSNRRGE